MGWFMYGEGERLRSEQAYLDSLRVKYGLDGSVPINCSGSSELVPGPYDTVFPEVGIVIKRGEDGSAIELVMASPLD